MFTFLILSISPHLVGEFVYIGIFWNFSMNYTSLEDMISLGMPNYVAGALTRYLDDITTPTQDISALKMERLREDLTDALIYALKNLWYTNVKWCPKPSSRWNSIYAGLVAEG